MGLFSKSSAPKLPQRREIGKNDRQKNAFFRFFELLYRKFTKIFVLNIIYALCILPVICGVIVLLTIAFKLPDELIRESYLIGITMSLVSRLPGFISLPILIADLILFGPLTAGFTYILRNYATEQHAWFSDFFSKAKENFKQGIGLGLIDALVFTSVVLYMALDITALAGTGTYYFYLFLKIAALIIGLIYVFMRFYTYTIMVTFELKLKDILKNAAIFTVLGFFRNVIAFVAIAATVFAFTSTKIVDIVLLFTFMFAFCGFIANFTTYPIIEKYMLKKDEPEEEYCEEDEEVPEE